MKAAISRHQIGKYRLKNGHCIDAFVVGDDTGYRSVVPVRISDGSVLSEVSIDAVRGKPVITQAGQWTYTPWILVRVTCYDKKKPFVVGHGYGSVYVDVKDIDNVVVVANGHCVSSGRKQNEVVLCVRQGTPILVRPANGRLGDARTLRYTSPGVATTGQPPSQAELHQSWVDICARDVVESLRFPKN